MKKLLFFSLVILCFTSCSSNDSETPTNPQAPGQAQDPIVGTWNLDKDNGFDVAPCIKKNTYVFKTDKTFTYTQYKDTNGNCAKDDSKSYKGEWKNNNNGTYFIKRHGFTSGTDAPIKFESNNQNMIIGKFTWLKK